MLLRFTTTRQIFTRRRYPLQFPISTPSPRYHHQNPWATLFSESPPARENPSKHYKRLIVCCDGTWKSSYKPNTAPTNVMRLCRAINTNQVKEDGTEIQQVVLYQAGVGATPMGWFKRHLAGGLGYGLDENICEAYQFIANNYEEGDEIFLFGYSRGAYTARAVSGLISNIGLLGKTSMHKFYDVYYEYQKRRNTPESVEIWENYVDRMVVQLDRQENVKIKVVGCWDTVGSLGLPELEIVRRMGWNRKYEFHDTQLSTGIENAFHCLALDECRWTYTPTLWYLPREASEDEMPTVIPVPSSKFKSKPSTHNSEAPPSPSSPNPLRVKLRQIWMIGVHSDVGGNNRFADISFNWMIDQCDKMLDFDMKYLCQEMKRNAYIRQDTTENEKHWTAGVIDDCMVGKFRFLGRKYRTPGAYRVKNRFGKDKIWGDTNEVVHPSVRIRTLQRPDWRPKALEGFEIVRVDGKGGKWKWVKEIEIDGKKERVEIHEYEVNEGSLEDVTLSEEDRALLRA